MATVATEPVKRLSRDLRSAAKTLGRDEARFLVDSYYQMQEQRKGLDNQERALARAHDCPKCGAVAGKACVEDGRTVEAVHEERVPEPHDTLGFFADQFDTLERQIRSALDVYSDAQPLGRWARSQVGIGPVIAAGLLAHIDIDKAPTAGHIWRFAGLDPSLRWEKGQKRPYNANLKVLCWKAADSFKKQSGRPNCFYGRLYQQRKEFEVNRDVAGGNAAAAARTLEERTIRDKQLRATYESGHLPAGRLDLRAMRWTVKLFLAHFQEVGWTIMMGSPPPDPYPISHQGHAHRIVPPNWPMEG
jgi:hypothetical protein